MKTVLLLILKIPLSSYQSKQKLNVALFYPKAVKEKWDDMEKAFLLNKRNPTIANAQKLKKESRELEYTKKNN